MPPLLFASIHGSLTLAATAMVLRVTWPTDLARQRTSRWLWTVAWLAYLLHVAIAMFVVHGSHATAYEHTARRTAELFGVHTGVGLYVNYLFTLWWSVDVVRSWRAASPMTFGSSRRGLVFDAALWFMSINGAVLFAQGWTRVWGVVICTAMVAAWGTRLRRR
jgi:hypothetical protein